MNNYGKITALYSRLSVGDEDRDGGESNSIVNQFDVGLVIFERQSRTNVDPYLETREKEDAFLLRVMETIRAGLNGSAPVNATDTLFQLLQGVQLRPTQIEEISPEDQQEVDDMALDFDTRHCGC